MIRIAFALLFGLLSVGCYAASYVGNAMRAEALAIERERQSTERPHEVTPRIESQSVTLVAHDPVAGGW